MRILLVEDDEMIGESVVAGLESEDYAVDWVKDGNSALIAMNTTPFSLVILDLASLARMASKSSANCALGEIRRRFL